MNTPKIMIAALLLSGMALNAKENPQINDAYESSRSTSIFKRKSTSNSVFKLNTKALGALSARDWNETEVNGGGFFVNVGLHFPFASFLAKNYSITDPRYRAGINDARYKLGYDFEFGNYFRFAKINDGLIGLGLRATWISVSYTKMSNGSDVYRTAQICLVKLGPQIGIAINETMGVDAFYQVGYNLTEEFGSIVDPKNPSKNIGQSATYSGISHEIGAAFHYKVYSLGLGIRFGRLTNQLNYYDGSAMDSKYTDDGKRSIGNFRITLGFKF